MSIRLRFRNNIHHGIDYVVEGSFFFLKNFIIIKGDQLNFYPFFHFQRFDFFIKLLIRFIQFRFHKIILTRANVLLNLIYEINPFDFLNFGEPTSFLTYHLD